MNPSQISRLITEDVSENNGTVLFKNMNDVTQFIFDNLFRKKVIAESLWGMNVDTETERFIKTALMEFITTYSDTLKGTDPEPAVVKNLLLRSLAGVADEKGKTLSEKFKEILGPEQFEKWVDTQVNTVIENWDLLNTPKEDDTEYDELPEKLKDKVSSSLDQRLRAVPPLRRATPPPKSLQK